MTDKDTQSAEDEPHERFRRLLSEVNAENLKLEEEAGELLHSSSDNETEWTGVESAQQESSPQDREATSGEAVPSATENDQQPTLTDRQPEGADQAPTQVVPPATDQEDTAPVRTSQARTTRRLNFDLKPASPQFRTDAPQSAGRRDVGAPRMSSKAYPPPADRQGTLYRGAGAPPGNRPRYTYPSPAARPAPRRLDFRQAFGCLLRMALVAIFFLVLTVLGGASFLVFQYYNIARSLPDIRDLRTHASQFETTRILDRNGNILYEILDPNAGRRTYVRLDKVSPYLVAATVATEDKGFYSHPGVDLLAIARAFWQNYQSGGTVSGASTITQQLARTLLLTPEERTERSYQRKIREAILATEITRRYSKDEILELYLNENYYGNLAYGVEAAAETYFGTTADKLTLGQAAFLAGLPQAPSIYDVYTNRDATLSRAESVLVLMFQASQEQGCIYVSNSPDPICVDPVSVTKAAEELKDYQFHSPNVQMRYPHWVNYIRYLLESQYDAQTIYRSGFSVYTTLDPGLQDAAETVVRDQVSKLTDKHASDGALVAIRPATGEILAMVGSADFYNETISGQVNMAVSPRQPGSSIKPLTYAAAFEKGWTPATLIWDVPSEFPPSGRSDDPRPPYKPVNYDSRFHGPVTVRTALANSYNVPAVKTLDFVGIYNDPRDPQKGGLIDFAKRMGITTLTRDDYGLSLTLGGGDVSLLELTAAYGIFANGGLRVPPVAITRILDHSGNVVYQYQQPPGEQVIRAEHAYLITSILSDNKARTPAFGPDSVLNLPFPVAAKTGTTNDFRDNWTLGYTPDVAVGVWVGNADFTPMQNTSGLTGAAPIWANIMQTAIQRLTGGNPTPFTKPGGVVDYVICAVSGTEPSKWCPKQTTEIFAADQPPLPQDQDLWQKVVLDTWTNLRASAACPDFTEQQFVLNVTDQWAKKWIRKDPKGQAWAEDNGFDDPVVFTPTRDCKADDPRPKLAFSSPRNGEQITSSPVDISVIADATDWFDYFTLEYGLGDDPVEWKLLEREKSPFDQPDKLLSWDLSQLVEEDDLQGIITLRLYMHSSEDTYAETKIRLNIQVPTPTPTPTATPTETPTPTMTPTITPTPMPLVTSTPAPTATQTKFPKATDTFTPVPTNTEG